MSTDRKPSGATFGATGEEVPFRLRWRRTWDVGDDFTGRDPTRPRAFARIYRPIGRPAEAAWFWTASDEHRHLASGQTDTARKAAASAEASLFGAEGLRVTTW